MDEDDFGIQVGDRLQIITPEEYELLWGLPRLTVTERPIMALRLGTIITDA